MIKLMVNIVLRVFTVLLSGIVVAIPGFIAGSMVFAVFGLEFNGREGYEAGGPMGFVLGALTGLVGSSVFFFRGRTAK